MSSFKKKPPAEMGIANHSLPEEFIHFLIRFFDQGLLGLVILTKERDWQFANAGFCGMMGYSFDQIKGIAWRDLGDHEDQKQEDRLIMEIIDGGLAHTTFEKRLRHRQGMMLTVRIFALPWRAVDGKPTHLILQIENITDRKEVEKNLIKSEAFYREVIENASGVPFRSIHGPASGTGFYEFIGAGIERLVGLSVEEFTEKRFVEMVQEVVPLLDEIPRDPVECRRAFTNGEILHYKADIRVITPQGGEKWINDTSLPYRDEKSGRVIGSFGILQDITDRKKVEEALRKSEATLQSIFRSAPTGIGLETRRTLIWINDRLSEITGFSQGELIGQSMAVLYPRRDLFEQVEREQEIEVRRNGAFTVETQWKSRDGKTIDILLSSTPLDARNFDLGITFTALDITDRKRAETELARHREHLEQLVEERTGELHQVMDQLERTNRDLAVANTELERLSLTDRLTELPNRRSFEMLLEQEWSRCARQKIPLSIVMLDIDFFKLYNDHYGHIRGDDCLKRVARVIAESVYRPGDHSSRYGGEEFVLILPETDREGARSVTERIFRILAEESISHQVSTVLPRVTISAGIATVVPTDGMLSTDLVQKADQALYQAKNEGRNRMIFYTDQ